MPFQYVWQSGVQKDHMKKSTPGKITFWVLPREANLDALAATINRINMRHTLLGGSVSVQGPNSPQLQRCWECRLLGHNDTACPKFSGTAVRLRFKLPFGPYEFSQLVQGSNTIRAAMLGNTHAREAWMPSYKATLFFNTPCTPEELNSFRQTLQTVSDLCQDRLHEPPHPVVMTHALRKSECVACGSRNSGHRCIFAGVARPQPQQPQAAAGKPAPSPAAAAVANPVTIPKPSEPAQTIEASMVHGMCGQWQVEKQCLHLESGKCNRKHDPKWLPVPETACRNWFFKRSCKFEDKCRFKHTTLEELQKAQGGPPSVAAAGAAAASSRQPSTGKRGSGAAAAASAVAPTTPRKEAKLSSLESLASPAASSLARTHSTPVASRSSSAKKNLALATKPTASASSAAAASAPHAVAAGAEEDPPFQEPKRRHKRQRTQQAQTAAGKSATAGKEAAAADIIDLDGADSAMEEDA
jgi:hypothetical protein